MDSKNRKVKNSLKNKKTPFCKHEFVSEKVIGIYHECCKGREYTFVIRRTNCTKCGKFRYAHIGMTEDNSCGKDR